MSDFSCDWHYAWGGPIGHCLFKSCPEDFRVDEELPFEPEGEGEHLYLLIEKTGHNTDWVAGQLARHAGVKRSVVSYAGRKDRQGITCQWFCVSLPGMPDPDWQGFETDTLKIVRQARHRRKLRTGALKANGFRIVLRGMDGDRSELEKRLALIAEKGVPNYFGSQRFGRENRNLDKAVALFEDKLRLPRNKRSMYLSAARSWLFNNVLSKRVEQQNWCSGIAGDIFGFHNNNSLIFDALDENIRQRINRNEICATGPLWGRGRLQSGDDCYRLEDDECGRYPVLCNGLEKAGLEQERRILRLLPENMEWSWQEDNNLLVTFCLPKGCFATSILRELVVCEEGDVNANPAV